MTQLEILHEMRSLSFFTSNCKSEQDRADYQKYRLIESELETAANNLKKGDKVQFQWNEKLPGTGRAGLPNFRTFLMEGEVSVPLKLKKREIMGEDCSIKQIKVVSGKYVYPVSPDRIVKL